ncbi:ThiF family protein [Aliiruegeria lutimaris]|uniref:ThiF family protein n=1 Tax=Aliiruegeria lutimaris TaxID=571298 RepID=A0A1G8VIF7_9RHOB|nr:ThiF family protein [Aliiruegeria lutimaris]
MVVEASDNFSTRHAVNRACFALGKPFVSGAAIRFAGQMSVYDPRQESSPCYACLFPEDSPVYEDRCASLGVFAPLTGTIGSMQAAEVLHLLVRGRSALTGRLLLYDALAAEWQEMELPRQPDCPVCSARESRMDGI